MVYYYSASIIEECATAGGVNPLYTTVIYLLE